MRRRRYDKRDFTLLITACVIVAPVIHAQNLEFEVASVKPMNSANPGAYALNCSSGTGFIAKEQTLLSLIEWAYDLPHGVNRVWGGPNWIGSPDTRFEVIGKLGRKATFEECRLMVQSVLAARFQVALHWETREVPVYTLILSQKGLKLHRTTSDPGALSSVTLNGARVQLGDGYRTTGSGRGMSMPELARFLSRLPAVGRPVIDETRLEGFYGFSLDYAMTLDDDTRPDIFSALTDQLGLKLESAKRPVELILIDHAEKPSEN